MAFNKSDKNVHEKSDNEGYKENDVISKIFARAGDLLSPIYHGVKTAVVDTINGKGTFWGNLNKKDDNSSSNYADTPSKKNNSSNINAIVTRTIQDPISLKIELQTMVAKKRSIEQKFLENVNGKTGTLELLNMTLQFAERGNQYGFIDFNQSYHEKSLELDELLNQYNDLVSEFKEILRVSMFNELSPDDKLFYQKESEPAQESMLYKALVDVYDQDILSGKKSTKLWVSETRNKINKLLGDCNENRDG